MKRNYERGERWRRKKKKKEKKKHTLQSPAEDIGGKSEYRLSNLNPK